MCVCARYNDSLIANCARMMMMLMAQTNPLTSLYEVRGDLGKTVLVHQSHHILYLHRLVPKTGACEKGYLESVKIESRIDGGMCSSGSLERGERPTNVFKTSFLREQPESQNQVINYIRNPHYFLVEKQRL